MPTLVSYYLKSVILIQVNMINISVLRLTNTQPQNMRTDSIESIRVSAANEIKNIDSQISKISDLEDIEDLQYLGSTVPSLLNLGLPQILEGIETELIELRSKYTANDISITRLVEKKSLRKTH